MAAAAGTSASPAVYIESSWMPVERLVDGGAIAGQEATGVRMGNDSRTVDLVEALRRAGNPRVAASQRLRRLLQEVTNRSRCGQSNGKGRLSIAGQLCDSGVAPEGAASGD